MLNENLIMTTYGEAQLKSMIRTSLEDVLLKINKNEQTSTNQDDEMLTLTEAAKLLRISKVTLHSWKTKGIIPFYRIGKRVLFKRNELLLCLKKIERKTRND